MTTKKNENPFHAITYINKKWSEKTYITIYFYGENKVKKICTTCKKIIPYAEKCGCRKNTAHQRDPEAIKFYRSYRWQQLRLRVLKDNPYCVRCFKKYKLINTENLQCHHILSFKHYPKERWNEHNLTILCKKCNIEIADKSIVDWEVTGDARDLVERYNINIGLWR